MENGIAMGYDVLWWTGLFIQSGYDTGLHRLPMVHLWNLLHFGLQLTINSLHIPIEGRDYIIKGGQTFYQKL